jgi:hypothetical protein
MADLENQFKVAELMGQDTLKAPPRNKLLGTVSDVLKPVVNATDVYSLDKRVPLLGGQTFAEATGMKGLQSLAEDMSYGAPLFRNTRNIQTATPDPRILDVMNAVPFIGGAAKLGTNLGKTAIKQAGQNIVEGRMPGIINPKDHIIPEVGGNFGVKFTNPSEEFINSHKKDILPGDQWVSWINANAPRAVKKELETAGTMDWLKTQPKVGKTEIKYHVKGNEPLLRSKTYQDYNASHPYEVIGNEEDGYAVVDSSMGDEEITPRGEQDEAYNEMQNIVEENYPQTKYEQYTLPGAAENYREIVIQYKPKVWSEEKKF